MSIKECNDIYKAAFGSHEPFDKKLFRFFGDSIETLEADGKTVSMLFKLPCVLQYDGKRTNIHYVYAAATHPDFRGRGFMSALIKRVCEESDSPLFLKPASESLVSFYKKLGFYCKYGVSEGAQAQILPHKKMRQLSKYCESCPDKFTLMFWGKLPQISEIEFPFTMD